MRPFTSTIPFADALRIVMDSARPIDRDEAIALDECDGRVAASDISSGVDVPPFDRAAMDGYAVVAADTAGATQAAPARLVRVDRLFTAQMPSRRVDPGECIEVATGAPMPPGADAVVMVEETQADDDVISIRAAAVAGQNIGRRAADIAIGQVVVRTGQWMGPARIGALAATGATSLRVFAKPTVAILSTGNEVADPGTPIAPGQIFDINRFTLGSIVRAHGGLAAPLPVAGDALESLHAALDGALAHDVVVLSGGSSVGDRDLILDVLRARGHVHFHGVAVKPGKPTAFATIGNTPVFAMPGYPTSCLSNGYMLLLPFLRAIARLPPWQPRTIELPLSRRVASAPGRHQFYTVRIAEGRAEPAFKASGDITSMADADGYIEIPASTDAVEAGTPVKITLFG